MNKGKQITLSEALSRIGRVLKTESEAEKEKHLIRALRFGGVKAFAQEIENGAQSLARCEVPLAFWTRAHAHEIVPQLHQVTAGPKSAVEGKELADLGSEEYFAIASNVRIFNNTLDDYLYPKEKRAPSVRTDKEKISRDEYINWVNQNDDLIRATTEAELMDLLDKEFAPRTVTRSWVRDTRGEKGVKKNPGRKPKV